VSMSLQSGEPSTIGPFSIVRVLGQGAMGVVYLGERMEQFSQRVAIKMLHPHVSLLFGENSLRHEEKVLTPLDHPAIVRLLDTAEHKGLRYIVMEYVEGLPLDDFCRKYALPTEQRILLLIEILRGVDYAHRHLVIHADLKPANILITPEWHAKILDFGVAVLVGSGVQDAAYSPAAFTPEFASPEQLANARATAATDIYSMGAIAQRLLSDDENAPAPLTNDLNAIVAKATRVEPERRYASTTEFANDLQAVLDHRPVEARKGGRRYRFGKWIRRYRSAAAIAGAVAVVLCSSVAGIVVKSADAAYQRRSTQKQLYALIRLTGTLEAELYGSLNGLPKSEDARASLLSGSNITLDGLSKLDGSDPELSVELAGQYETIARLQLANRTPGDEISIRSELDRGIALLRSVPRSSKLSSGAEVGIDEMMKLRRSV
jgi:predicted Ser/Thr protein kinase